MKSVTEQRDELIATLCDVLQTIAEEKASFTAQSFIDRARALGRFGNTERAIEYLNIARSYVLPKRVTL